MTPKAAALFASAALLVAPLTVLPVAAQPQQGEMQGQGARGVTIEAILDNPRQYYGQQVTVTGEVAAILGPRSFVVLAGVRAPGAEGTIPGVETTAVGELPVVVSASPDGPSLDLHNLMERVVRATGTVHQFNLRAFEDRLRGDLRDSVWAGFSGRPAIIATRVEPVLPEQASAVQPGQQAQPGRQAPAGQQDQPVVRQSPGGTPTIDDILDNPQRYYGQQIELIGDVGDVLGPRSFSLTYDYPVLGQEVPVVVAQPIRDSNGRPVDLNQWTTRQVRVTGTVHQFNLAAFENRLGLDLDDSAWSEFRGGPAIIAAQVVPVTGSNQSVQDGGVPSGQAGWPRG